MDTNKVHTLLDRHELGEIELTEREYRFLDVWTRGQTAEVNRIYMNIAETEELGREEKGP